MARHLFVYLHGHGSSPAEVDEIITAVDPTRSYIAVTPEGPIAVSATGRAWFEDGTRGTEVASLQRAVEWVSNVLGGTTTDLGVPLSHVVLGGYSQGAATALAVAASLSAPLGGMLLQSPFVPDGPDIELDLATVPAMPVLLQHGTRDDVVPTFFVEHVAAQLASAGCEVEVQPFAAGHTRTPEMAEAARVWLRSRIV